MPSKLLDSSVVIFLDKHANFIFMFKHLLWALHCEISQKFVDSSTTNIMIVVGSN